MFEDNPLGADPSEFDELRQLIQAPLARRVARLERQARARTTDAAAVADVLPEAIIARNQDDKLARALEPTLDAAIRSQVKKNPDLFVEAVYPVLGPAIRKAIAASTRALVQSMNQTLEHSLSTRGLSWRFEALRTGRSFGEVVMRHTLLWRAEHVFLIHHETGLLLGHRHQGVSEVSDNADVISGMLTAITDFVADSFDVADGEPLQSMQVGDLSVWVERGPDAVLAAVLRGDAPEDYRTDLQIALEEIHLRFAEPLGEYAGDNAPFADAEPLLDELLQLQVEPPASRPSPMLLILLLVLLAAVTFGGIALRDHRARWDASLARIEAEPGWVVTDTGRRGPQRLLSALRDPLALDAESLLAAAEVPAGDIAVQTEAFLSLDPPIVLARARAALAAPANVDLSLDGSTLHATGRASHRWRQQAGLLASAVPGIDRIDLDSVIDEDLEELAAQAAELGHRQLRFREGKTVLAPGQDALLEDISDGLRALYDSARRLGQSFDLEVVGHTDSSGDPDRNLLLSRARAEAVRDALRRQGLRDVPLNARGVGSQQPLVPEDTEEGRETNRRVTFGVRLIEVAGPREEAP